MADTTQTNETTPMANAAGAAQAPKPEAQPKDDKKKAAQAPKPEASRKMTMDDAIFEDYKRGLNYYQLADKYMQMDNEQAIDRVRKAVEDRLESVE